MTKLQKFTFNNLLIVFLLLGSISSIMAQSYSYGKLIVENNGEMKLYGVTNYRINSANNTKGIIGTERSGNKGYISFMQDATWVAAANDAFVDGYVKSYQPNPFIFPIGDNNAFRPAKISMSSKSNPTEAAYYGINPSIAITSPFFGSTSIALPVGATFNTSLMENTIAKVSTKEYWDINGNTPAKISLSWDANSDISTMTKGVLNNLVMVGWDGTKWNEIPSNIDAISIFGFASSITMGSITTSTAIVPSTYSVYTLASLFPDKKSIFSVKARNNVVAQNQSLSSIFTYSPNINDTNLVVTITQSTPKFGTITNATMNGYTYTANNTHIGIDSILSIARIHNKPSGIIAYDTFVNEIIVLYQKVDTFIDMGSKTMITLGKPFIKTQNLSYRYSFKTQYGLLDQFNAGTFRYQSGKYNFIDTVYIYFEVNYMGLLIYTDTTQYIIKLANGINGVNSTIVLDFQIPNYLSPNGDGSNDYWVMPQEMTSKYSKIGVNIYNLDGKMIYNTTNYQNDWPTQNKYPEGIYLYQIELENELPIKGLMRISNQ